MAMAMSSHATGSSSTMAVFVASKSSILSTTSCPAIHPARKCCFSHVSTCRDIICPRRTAPQFSFWASLFTSSLLALRSAPHAMKRARAARLTLPAGHGYSRYNLTHGFHSVVAKLQDENQQGVGAAETAAIAGGLIAIPVVAWSLYTLKTTGCGLPPGPGGAIGALEGVSYLVILGLIGWSIYTKVKTGSGLPSGPFGLLGAVEGLSFLTVLGIGLVFGLQYLDYGYIPGPVPGEQCFG
ncbi:hypothetical protein O6H91_16G048100 [Diphasiastrum complanatum]|uniref:Uncharacterized protein n=1 Tax=Diphasiastrum complanatum TaxID=34168 RepID=A0ACC2BC20_DIPCM|nr:hypothetical protein O6H91_Y053200 [Diphasiastrum complanatum]KAJ7297490.1 hypothetical protein O6H91_Y053200 [Diphasiastrum complanatum]KAJ7527310.1 hypothetical protein O6H91_16G048100 [Diphasiastrum complanatum]